MQIIKDFFNSLADPRLFFLMTVAALIFMIWKREIFAQKAVGYGLLGFLFVFLVFGYFDENFQLIILKPDNVPIVSQSATPNPSKAPWYFLGLQEMLVYFDPWLAGVVLPSLIIVGLIAIPYIDKNEKGNGYYTIAERKAEIFLFLLGFVVLWCSLIVLGTFLRGPNWNFFGPFEYWDTHKLEALTNVNLSEYIWVRMLSTGLPTNWFVRELFGIILVLAYVLVLPVLLAKTLFKDYLAKMGPPRYYVGVFLFLMMMSLPIKMLLRWIVNLKYIVGIPEYFFNI
jgi:hypothetical protein